MEVLSFFMHFISIPRIAVQKQPDPRVNFLINFWHPPPPPPPPHTHTTTTTTTLIKMIWRVYLNFWYRNISASVEFEYLKNNLWLVFFTKTLKEKMKSLILRKHIRDVLWLNSSNFTCWL